jgi:hypothetical protein
MMTKCITKVGGSATQLTKITSFTTEKLVSPDPVLVRDWVIPSRKVRLV